MSGYEVKRNATKNTALFDKYQCPHCSRLLKKAVQPVCAHWLCESCADELLASSSPKCPRPDCQEDLRADPESQYFPDRFVRREIEGLIICCPHQQAGCIWEDQLGSLEDHLRSCDFVSERCADCGVTLTLDEMESHNRVCPKALRKCPLESFGCSTSKPMLLADLKKHVLDHGVEHLELISDVLKLIQGKPAPQLTKLHKADFDNDSTVSSFGGQHTGISNTKDKEIGTPRNSKRESGFPEDADSSLGDIFPLKLESPSPQQEKGGSGIAQMAHAFIRHPHAIADDSHLNEYAYRKDIQKLEKEFRQLQQVINESKCTVQVRGSFLCQPNDTQGGIQGDTMIPMWKIFSFSQKMADAQAGKKTSIYSLPSYLEKYKVCLQLYIMGDDVGKNSHMSLYLVIMKGEFDNILQWPFTHKVTFKLINQTGGRDIIDTFQPDPMSSSFRKPKSDMNIASAVHALSLMLNSRVGDLLWMTLCLLIVLWMSK